VNRPCPILVNTWEAVYLNISHDKVVSIARSAKQLGIEMVVVDDGWFAKRNSVSTSLGDWVPDKDKFPFGIRGLVDQVNAEGMDLGIWIEPEMVSAPCV
jgi:alpha-galactosidase